MDHDEEHASEAERAEAEALARAVDDPADPAPGSAAATVAGLRAGRSAPGLDPAVKARLVARAVTRARASRRRRWALPAGLALAAAAGVLLVLATLSPSASDVSVVAPYGGPADAVFDAPFPDDQRASERLDRLTAARAHDYFTALAGGAR